MSRDISLHPMPFGVFSDGSISPWEKRFEGEKIFVRAAFLPEE